MQPPKVHVFFLVRHTYIRYFALLSAILDISWIELELVLVAVTPYREAIVVCSFSWDVYSSAVSKQKVVSIETVAFIPSWTGSDVILPRFESNDIIILSSDWSAHMQPCHLVGISFTFPCT